MATKSLAPHPPDPADLFLGNPRPGEFALRRCGRSGETAAQPLPEKVELSATLGVGLPTGASKITGVGTQPYSNFHG